MTDENDTQSTSAPRPEPERIFPLIQRIDRGDIKLPSFQRPQVWNVGQAIDLLDSIYRGYPIGSLLFWRTSDQLSSERNIGDFSLPDPPETYPRNYVLDGQQRLTTLFAVLAHPPNQLPERLKVVYDLESQAFVEAKQTLRSTQIPLHVLHDTPQYLKFVGELGKLDNSTELIQETQRLWETFREYVIPVTTVIGAPIDKVGIIFERINSRGTRLTVFDLMVAATWGSQEHSEFNLRERVDTIVSQLDEKDYGDIEDVTILRSLAVVSTGSARRESIIGLRRLGQEELELAIERTREALTGTVDFLVSHCCAISNDFLPYERQLILLAYVISKRGSLSASEVRVLQQWFWRTSFAERYRAGGEALFDEDLEKALEALESPEELSRYGKEPDKGFFIASQFRKGAAASQAFSALLGLQRPRNLTNGQVIDVGTALSVYNRKEFHHIFPQRVLKDWGVPDNLTNSLANICLLSSAENKSIGAKRPSEYVRKLQDDLGEEFEAVMDSNLIPPEAIRSMLEDDLAGFLDARADHLRSIVVSLI